MTKKKKDGPKPGPSVKSAKETNRYARFARKQLITVQCPTCRGSGRRGDRKCGLCEGDGKIQVPEDK